MSKLALISTLKKVCKKKQTETNSLKNLLVYSRYTEWSHDLLSSLIVSVYEKTAYSINCPDFLDWDRLQTSYDMIMGQFCASVHLCLTYMCRRFMYMCNENGNLIIMLNIDIPCMFKFYTLLLELTLLSIALSMTANFEEQFNTSSLMLVLNVKT